MFLTNSLDPDGVLQNLYKGFVHENYENRDKTNDLWQITHSN